MIYNFIKNTFGNLNSPIIFELGANRGQDTLKFFEFLKTPIIYAFEPDIVHFEHLKNIKINDIVNLYNLAISDKDNEEVTFYQSWKKDYNTGSSSILIPKNHLNEWPEISFVETKAKTITLDYFCDNNNINHIDFIWADIQGAEGKMISGGQKILRKTKYLYTEYSNNELYEGQVKLDDLKKLLPGNWCVVKDFLSDVLLKNNDLCDI